MLDVKKMIKGYFSRLLDNVPVLDALTNQFCLFLARSIFGSIFERGFLRLAFSLALFPFVFISVSLSATVISLFAKLDLNKCQQSFSFTQSSTKRIQNAIFILSLMFPIALAYFFSSQVLSFATAVIFQFKNAVKEKNILQMMGRLVENTYFKFASISFFSFGFLYLIDRYLQNHFSVSVEILGNEKKLFSKKPVVQSSNFKESFEGTPKAEKDDRKVEREALQLKEPKSRDPEVSVNFNIGYSPSLDNIFGTSTYWSYVLGQSKVGPQDLLNKSELNEMEKRASLCGVKPSELHQTLYAKVVPIDYQESALKPFMASVICNPVCLFVEFDHSNADTIRDSLIRVLNFFNFLLYNTPKANPEQKRDLIEFMNNFLQINNVTQAHSHKEIAKVSNSDLYQVCYTNLNEKGKSLMNQWRYMHDKALSDEAKQAHPAVPSPL